MQLSHKLDQAEDEFNKTQPKPFGSMGNFMQLFYFYDHTEIDHKCCRGGAVLTSRLHTRRSSTRQSGSSGNVSKADLRSGWSE